MCAPAADAFTQRTGKICAKSASLDLLRPAGIFSGAMRPRKVRHPIAGREIDMGAPVVEVDNEWGALRLFMLGADAVKMTSGQFPRTLARQMDRKSQGFREKDHARVH